MTSKGLQEYFQMKDQQAPHDYYVNDLFLDFSPLINISRL